MLNYHRIISIKYIICQATIVAANPWQVAATPFATNWILGGVKMELQNQLQNVGEFNGIQSFPSAWVGDARLWHVRLTIVNSSSNVKESPYSPRPTMPHPKKHSINICFSYQLPTCSFWNAEKGRVLVPTRILHCQASIEHHSFGFTCG
jgi:hypothetical protein